MVEHLPPGSPWHRERAGTPWLDQDWMLHDVSSRLRELVILTHNVWRAKDERAREVTYLPTPPKPDDDDTGAEVAGVPGAAERAELAALVHRGG